MNCDMTVACGDGLINIRVGAIILKNGKLLFFRTELRHPVQEVKHFVTDDREK